MHLCVLSGYNFCLLTLNDIFFGVTHPINIYQGPELDKNQVVNIRITSISSMQIVELFLNGQNLDSYSNNLDMCLIWCHPPYK